MAKVSLPWKSEKTIGHLMAEPGDNELKALDTVVLVGRYLPLIGKLLLQGIVKYARLHDLKKVAISRFVHQLLSSNLTSCPDVWEKGSKLGEVPTPDEDMVNNES